MNISDISAAKVARTEDNRDVTPEELLRAILGQLDDINAKSVYVALLEEDGDILDFHHFRANLTWAEENLMLDLCKRNLLNKYVGE